MSQLYPDVIYGGDWLQHGEANAIERRVLLLGVSERRHATLGASEGSTSLGLEAEGAQKKHGWGPLWQDVVWWGCRLKVKKQNREVGVCRWRDCSKIFVHLQSWIAAKM